MRRALRIVGIVCILMGLVWMGQGSGYFPYPKSSFMIDQSPWIWRGLGLAVVGLVLVVLSRRLEGRTRSRSYVKKSIPNRKAHGAADAARLAIARHVIDHLAAAPHRTRGDDP